MFPCMFYSPNPLTNSPSFILLSSQFYITIQASKQREEKKHSEGPVAGNPIQEIPLHLSLSFGPSIKNRRKKKPRRRLPAALSLTIHHLSSTILTAQNLHRKSTAPQPTSSRTRPTHHPCSAEERKPQIVHHIQPEQNPHATPTPPFHLAWNRPYTHCNLHNCSTPALATIQTPLSSVARTTIHRQTTLRLKSGLHHLNPSIAHTTNLTLGSRRPKQKDPTLQLLLRIPITRPQLRPPSPTGPLQPKHNRKTHSPTSTRRSPLS